MYNCAKAFKRTFLRLFYPAEHPPSPSCPSTNGDFPCRQPFFLSCVDDDDADDADDGGNDDDNDGGGENGDDCDGDDDGSDPLMEAFRAGHQAFLLGLTPPPTVQLQVGECLG